MALAVPAPWDPLDDDVIVERLPGDATLEVRFTGGRVAVLRFDRSPGPDEQATSPRCAGGGVDLTVLEGDDPVWIDGICARLSTRPPQLPRDELPAWGVADATVTSWLGALYVDWDDTHLRYTRAPGPDAPDQPRCASRGVGLYIDAPEADPALADQLCDRLAKRQPALPPSPVGPFHRLLAVLTLLVGLAWVWRRAAWRTALGVAAAGAGWTALAARVIGPRLDVGWFQPLREGYSLASLRMATGDALDLGIVPGEVWQVWLTSGPPSARTAVTTSLVLAGWAAILLGAHASRLGGHRWSMAAVWLGAVASPAWLMMALSPQHAASAAWYAAVAVCLVGIALDARSGRVLTAAATLALAGWGLSATEVRPELVGPAVATVVGVLFTVALPTWETRIASAVVGWRQRIGWRLWLLPLGWVALYPLLALVPRPHLEDRLGWVLAGLHPARIDLLTLPVVLAAMLPLGVVGLALRGAWTALARPARFGFLPLLIPALYMTMRSAAHGVAWPSGQAIAAFELYRYLLVLVGPVTILALHGAATLDLATRGRAILALLCLGPTLPWLIQPLGMFPSHAAWPSRSGITTDMQLEQRALVTWLEANPHCALLSIGREWSAEPDAPFRWAAIVRDGTRTRFATGPRVSEAGLTEAIGMLGNPRCGAAWRSLDCDTAGSDPCTALDPLRELSVNKIAHRSFVHEEHGSTWAREVNLGLLTLPGLAPSLPVESPRPN